MRFAKRKVKPGFMGRGGLKVGFVATVDCAILIAAKELGLFDRHGLSVQLTREVGWATIREKLLHEELDAVAAHASMAFSIYCGIGVTRRPCLTGLMLGLNGSAITLSNELWDLGVRDALTLGRLVKARAGSLVLNLGVALDLSSQNYNLREWLKSGGIDPDRDVRITTIPSVVMYDSFQAGYLDGYCVAEPWNTAAVRNKTGWVAAVASEAAPGQPEKILLVLQEFAEKREEEHLRLIAALIEASRFCDIPANRRELARMLAQPQYFDVPEDYLTNCLVGPFDFGPTRRATPNFIVLDAMSGGAPSRAAGKRVFDIIRNLNPIADAAALHTDMIAKVFREDIFEAAARLVTGAAPDSPRKPAHSAGPIISPHRTAPPRIPITLHV